MEGAVGRMGFLIGGPRVRAAAGCSSILTWETFGCRRNDEPPSPALLILMSKIPRPASLDATFAPPRNFSRSLMKSVTAFQVFELLRRSCRSLRISLRMCRMSPLRSVGLVRCGY